MTRKRDRVRKRAKGIISPRIIGNVCTVIATVKYLGVRYLMWFGLFELIYNLWRILV